MNGNDYSRMLAITSKLKDLDEEVRWLESKRAEIMGFIEEPFDPAASHEFNLLATMDEGDRITEKQAALAWTFSSRLEGEANAVEYGVKMMREALDGTDALELAVRYDQAVAKRKRAEVEALKQYIAKRDAQLAEDERKARETDPEAMAARISELEQIIKKTKKGGMNQ